MKSNEDIIAQRFREAERLTLRDRPQRKKRDWQKTKCPSCGYRVDYDPKPNWSGTLKCPHCGKIFKVTRLSDFAEEEK